MTKCYIYIYLNILQMRTLNTCYLNSDTGFCPQFIHIPDVCIIFSCKMYLLYIYTQTVNFNNYLLGN